jgi:drug/metabolite transporter (DMT)-like permease
MVRRLRGVDVVVVSAAHLLIGGVVLAGVALAVEGVPQIDWTPRFVAVLAFLGLVGTAATTLAWFVETQRCPLSSLTPWMFLVPVFGLLIGIIVLGERPDAWTATGIALVLLSTWAALTQDGITGAPGHLHVADLPSGADGQLPTRPGQPPPQDPIRPTNLRRTR